MIRRAGYITPSIAALGTGLLIAAGAQPAGARDAVLAQAQQPAPDTQPTAPEQAPVSPPAAPAAPAPSGETAPAEGTPGGSGAVVSPQVLDEPVEPQFDLSKLPFPVQRMRELLIEAAKSGDVEKLRPYIGAGDDATMLSLGGLDADPIEFLKSLSGDGQGYEILAILEDVLQNGFVQMDAGTENEIFIWPYFYTMPLDKLTPAQRVELYRLVTHGDYEDMKSFGAYNFYRVGITPQGRWRFFVAGD
jgi:hypothetical protein